MYIPTKRLCKVRDSCLCMCIAESITQLLSFVAVDFDSSQVTSQQWQLAYNKHITVSTILLLHLNWLRQPHNKKNGEANQDNQALISNRRPFGESWSWPLETRWTNFNLCQQLARQDYKKIICTEGKHKRESSSEAWQLLKGPSYGKPPFTGSWKKGCKLQCHVKICPEQWPMVEVQGTQTLRVYAGVLNMGKHIQNSWLTPFPLPVDEFVLFFVFLIWCVIFDVKNAPEKGKNRKQQITYLIRLHPEYIKTWTETNGKCSS